MVSFQNVTVITDFMSKPEYANRSGQVRDIIVNEFGVSATQGEDVQIAALCAAFYSFEKNPYITQVIYLDNLGVVWTPVCPSVDGRPLTALVHR